MDQQPIRLNQTQTPQQQNQQRQASFVDTSPYFNDLNASFKRLYKSIIDNRDVYESGKYKYTWIFYLYLINLFIMFVESIFYFRI